MSEGEIETACSVDEVVGGMEGRVRGEPRKVFFSMPCRLIRGWDSIRV